MALQRSYVGELVKPGFNSLVFEWVPGSAPQPKPVAVAAEKPAPRAKAARKSASAKPRRDK